MLGMNIAMIVKTLLRVAKVPHTKIKNLLENLQKPFSCAMSFVCILAQLRRLQETEIHRIVVASMPRNFCLKIVSRPLVVAVSVWDSIKISTCSVTCMYTSTPENSENTTSK